MTYYYSHKQRLVVLFVFVVLSSFSSMARADVQIEIQKILPADLAENDNFGGAIALDGNTAIIASANADSSNGVVYVYEHDGAQWIEQAQLVPDSSQGDFFGTSVALNGDTALVGVAGDDEFDINTGAAYVFVRNGDQWQQTAKLTASDARRGDSFGWSVGLSNRSAIIGARGNDSVGFNAGAAYVFTGSGSQWTEQSKLVASDANSGDSFGYSVAIDSDTALVGAYAADGNAINTGAVYVFDRNGGNWSESARIEIADSANSDFFGWSVSLDGTVALIGAWLDDSAGVNSGAAYVFEKSAAGWSKTAKLVASDASIDDSFGWSVSLDGNIALIGAYSGNSFTDDIGSAYVFERDGAAWMQKIKLTSSTGFAEDRFGIAVAVDGATAMVGASMDSINDTGAAAGAVYVYKNADSQPLIVSPGTVLTNSNGTEVFGWSANTTPVSRWWFYLGSQPGGRDYFDSNSLASTVLSTEVSGLPVDGSAVYARLWYRLDGDNSWYSIDADFTSVDVDEPMMISPAFNSVLSGASVMFIWQDSSSSITEYWLNAGSAIGGSDYFNSGNLGLSTSSMVTGLPADGTSMVYVRLWYRFSTGDPWLYIDETFTAGTAGIPDITSHTSHGQFTDVSGTEALSWIENGSGATEYWIHAGSSMGGRQFSDTGSLGNSLSALVNGLPTDGSTIWIRFWYRDSAGVWRFIDEEFTAVVSLPTIESSNSAEGLTSPSDTFIWTDPSGTVTHWWLYVGSTVSGRDYEDSGSIGSATSYTTQNNNLPTGVMPIYVRLWYRKSNGPWQSIDEVFTSAL